MKIKQRNFRSKYAQSGKVNSFLCTAFCHGKSLVKCSSFNIKRKNKKHGYFRYALANVMLIMGAKLEVPLLILPWLLTTVGFLIWSFVLVSVMFAWDTTSGFAGGVAVAQLINFAVCMR